MPGLVSFRRYQEPVFRDRETKTQILHWSRQIGKSFTLGAWSLDRTLTRPGRLVTVLSSSRDNGAEFVEACREICDLGRAAMAHASVEIEDLSEDLEFLNMKFEVRVTVGDKTGRIKVLAANPRTARGFSGDLVLDEFAFHEDSSAIWEAAEPIISSNPDFLCRISSTGNGKQNMFYQLISEGRIPVNRMSRSQAYRDGQLKIYSLIDGREITPEEAREEASDKAAYDQNYELGWSDSTMHFLTQEQISSAEKSQPEVTIDSQKWSAATVQRIWRARNDVYLGMDLARVRNFSVIAAVERVGQERRTLGLLEMQGLSGPDQLEQLKFVCEAPRFRRGCIDSTGMGAFFIDFAQKAYGSRIEGVNFSTTEPINERLRREGRRDATAKVTELMALDLLTLFEDGIISIPASAVLRDDLRKPKRVVSPGGKVSVAAADDPSGHADRFWSYCLAERAQRHGTATGYQGVTRRPGKKKRQDRRPKRLTT